MALMPAPKPLAASLTKQPRKFPTNASPTAAAALGAAASKLANVGVVKPPAPAGDAALRAATAAQTGNLPVKPPVGPRMAAPGRPRGFGSAFKG